MDGVPADLDQNAHQVDDGLVRSSNAREPGRAPNALSRSSQRNADMAQINQDQIRETSMFNKSEIENMMARCVDEIWEKHDTDGNGVKSNEEIKHILRKLVSDMSEGGEINEAEFEQSYRKIKRNSHGAIDKINMVQWLKTMVQG